MQKDTPMGKAYAKAAPAYGSSGPGDEPVRVGVGPAALTDEQNFNDFLRDLADSPEWQIVGVLTAIGLTEFTAKSISRGLTGTKGRPFPTIDRLSKIGLNQAQYRDAVKQFGKFVLQIGDIPAELKASNFKNPDYKINEAQKQSAFRKYANDEIKRSFGEYKNIPTEDNRISFNKVINKYGGPEHITIKSTDNAIQIGIRESNPTYQKWIDKTLAMSEAEKYANDAAARAALAVKNIKERTNTSQAQAEKIAGRSAGGAVKSGISAVGNAYNNALSFLRGGGPKTMGK